MKDLKNWTRYEIFKCLDLWKYISLKEENEMKMCSPFHFMLYLEWMSFLNNDEINILNSHNKVNFIHSWAPNWICVTTFPPLSPATKADINSASLLVTMITFVRIVLASLQIILRPANVLRIMGNGSMSVFGSSDGMS